MNQPLTKTAQDKVWGGGGCRQMVSRHMSHKRLWERRAPHQTDPSSLLYQNLDLGP